MAEAQRCVVKGCGGIACYGVGSLRKHTLRFACRAHRDLIGWQAVPPSPPPAAGEGRPSPAAPLDPAQGRLL